MDGGGEFSATVCPDHDVAVDTREVDESPAGSVCRE
jgi:hypothetical protein